MIDAHAAGSLPLMVQSGTTHQQPMQRWGSLGVDLNARGAENDGSGVPASPVPRRDEGAEAHQQS
jgi:hypothetical protein